MKKLIFKPKLFLYFLLICFPFLANSQTIVGKVISFEDNEPLPGVSVMIKGTNKGSSTDANGEFKITGANSKSILVFSYVGYLGQEQAVGTRNSISVKLVQDSKALDEVVVVGYGEINKSDLTGSVSQIKAQGITEKPISTVEQFLQGRVSGVQITQASGSPGGGLNFVIRGGNSTSDNQPLIVIDGYPIEAGNGNLSTGGDSFASQQPPFNPLANINPNEIESIEILKDASSTAIYGSRGANGVVLITTKRGKKGADKIEFNYRSDFNQVRRKLNVLSPKDFLAFANEGAINDKLTPIYADSTVARLSQLNNNWQDLIFRDAVTHDYQLGISGGEGKTNYAVIGNYSTNEGTIKGSFFNRGGIRANFDRTFSDRFKLGINVNASQTISKLGVNGGPGGLSSASVVSSALYVLPLTNAYNELGEIDQTFESNPALMVDLVKDTFKNTLFFTNLNGALKLNDYLTFKSNIGANYSNGLRQVYYPRGTFTGRNNNGYAYQNQNERFNYLTEFTLNYNRKIGKHNINSVLGHTYQRWNVDGLQTTASQFPNDNLGYYAFQTANAQGVTTTTHQEWALASFLGRINYSFDNRYLFTFTGRSDGASRLAVGNQWAFFPSLAIGWNIHNEKFMDKFSFIETLKLRSSYGLSGNQSVALGATNSFLSSDLANIGGAISRGYILNNIGNPLLGWENTTQINAGLEIGVLKNRLTFEVNVYQKNTKNLLINFPLPAANGFTSYLANAGEIENRGIEFDLLARVSEKLVKWTVSGNLSMNENKVLSLGSLGSTGNIFGPNYLSANNALNQPIHTTQEGKPVGVFYGYRINGIYQNVEEVNNGPEKTSAKPGDFKFVDLNGDGIINANDREMIGNPNPKMIFGVTNDFTYKRISLSVFFQGVLGNDIANLNRFRMDALTGNVVNVFKEAYDGRWTGEGTSNYYPRARAVGAFFNGRFSDFIIEDGSFVRLKNVTLSYDLSTPQSLKFIKSAKLFFTGTNLLTFTNYTGFDPEVNANFNNPLAQGVDNGSYPQNKTFSVGLNLKF
jgi:TonB-linked SusC/RagA family outer membrane protein